MLAEAGFTDVEVKTLPHDAMNNCYLARKRSGLPDPPAAELR